MKLCMHGNSISTDRSFMVGYNWVLSPEGTGKVWSGQKLANTSVTLFVHPLPYLLHTIQSKS